MESDTGEQSQKKKHLSLNLQAVIYLKMKVGSDQRVMYPKLWIVAGNLKTQINQNPLQICCSTLVKMT